MEISQQTPIRRATVLVNPVARSVTRRFDAEGAMRFLAARGVEAILDYPESTAASAAKSAERGDDVLFVVGGDGTLRQAAAGLAGSETALAAIPAGTTNVWAKEAGIPHGVRTAFESHLSGQRVAIDLGRANGEPFLLMASAGWDAAVVERVDHRLKARTGQLAYIAATMTRLTGFRTTHAHFRSGLLQWDIPLAVAIISNTRLYGGLVQPSPLASATDGLLDFAALSPLNVRDTARLAGRLATRRLHNDLRAITARLDEITLETPGIPYQLDGDHAGRSPVEVKLQPLGLRVSVPGGALPPILM